MFLLRKATPADSEQIISLIDLVRAGYNWESNLKEIDNDVVNLDKYYFDNRGWFGVIDYKSHIVGSYGLMYLSDNTCELRKMYLQPRFHGFGFGRIMLEDALKKARELGYSEIRLETNKILETAIALYKKYGFEEDHSGYRSLHCNHAIKRF